MHSIALQQLSKDSIIVTYLPQQQWFTFYDAKTKKLKVRKCTVESNKCLMSSLVCCFKTHMLLQFINIINFCHFSPNSVVNQVQIWTVGSHRCGEMKAGVSHSRSSVCSSTALSYWKIKNLPEISHMTGNSCSVSSMSRQCVPLILTPGTTIIS